VKADLLLPLALPLPPQLVKLCSGMIEAGRAYVSANKLFVNGIKDLSLQCKKEEMISVSVGFLSGGDCIHNILGMCCVCVCSVSTFHCDLTTSPADSEAEQRQPVLETSQSK